MLQESQAHIMLAAACNYIQECSRIGWDRYPNTTAGTNPGSPTQYNNRPGSSYPAATDSDDPFPGDSPAVSNFPVHEETFGWVDVRDGTPGPTTQEGRICYDPTLTGVMWWQSTPNNLLPAWPAPTSIVRCPMYVWQRPPYATQLTASYNPIDQNSADAEYLWPLLRYPDPQPQVSNGWTPGSTSISTTLYDDGQNGATQSDFIHGDPTPRVQSQNKSWFRILRDGPATFLITAGAGGTMGFRSYNEALNQGYAQLFNYDYTYFQNLSSSEFRIFYRVEWTAAVTEVTYHWILHASSNNGADFYTQWPMNASHSWSYGCRSPGFDRNMGGTFRWIQRLRAEPTNW